MLYLSRNDLEKIAEGIIDQYKVKAQVPKFPGYFVDPTVLAAQHGFHVVYEHITRDGSILGETSNGAIWTTIVDADLEDTFFYLDGRTILVEKRLLFDHRGNGRRKRLLATEMSEMWQ